MKNWYIEITEENNSELLKWWNGNVSNGCRPPCVGEYLMSKNPKDNSRFWSKIDTDHHGLDWQQQYELITLEQFRQITNSNKMKHPKKWYIVATKENFNELNAWRKTVAESCHSGFSIDNPLLSKHLGDDSYYYGASVDRFKSDSDYNDYQEITLEQFRQITGSKSISETTAIQISRNLLNEYYEASTTAQKEYLSEHFKLNGCTTVGAIRGLYELACGEWKPKIKANHPDCFPKESKYFDFSKHTNQYGCDSIVSSDVAYSLGLCRNFIQVRAGDSNEKDRAFYLTSEYNWELIRHGTDMVLIPTKKVK